MKIEYVYIVSVSLFDASQKLNFKQNLLENHIRYQKDKHTTKKSVNFPLEPFLIYFKFCFLPIKKIKNKTTISNWQFI